MAQPSIHNNFILFGFLKILTAEAHSGIDNRSGYDKMTAVTAVPPDNDAPSLYQYVSSLTRPVRYCSETGLHTPTVGAAISRP